MKRWIFNIFAGLSLLLCMATVVLWIRSYWYTDKLDLGAWKDRSHLTLRMNSGYTEHGHFLICTQWLHFVDATRSPNTIRRYFDYQFWGVMFSINVEGYYAAPELLDTLMGFGIKQIPTYTLWNRTAETSEMRIIIPLWLFTVVAALMPAFWVQKSWRRISHHRRIIRGLCLNCGYDLRSHKPGEKCPECGTVITPINQQTL